MANLKPQVVIITGASSGIGRATALLLASKGASVVLAARRMECLLSLREEIKSAGGSEGAVIPVRTDITAPADRERLIREALSHFGRIDALVNNAGYGQRGPIELLEIESIRQNFETNLFALIALTQLVIPILREQGGGRIINIGSVAGKIARPFTSAYDATKHALEAISDGLRGELSLFGIDVILIQPGFIQTEFAEVANQLAHGLAKEGSPYAPFMEKIRRNPARFRRIAGKPDDIAQLVYRALAARNPAPRYAAPSHAHLFLAFKRFIPERLFEAYLHRAMGIRRRAAASRSEGIHHKATKDTKKY